MQRGLKASWSSCGSLLSQRGVGAVSTGIGLPVAVLWLSSLEEGVERCEQWPGSSVPVGDGGWLGEEAIGSGVPGTCREEAAFFPDSCSCKSWPSSFLE